MRSKGIKIGLFRPISLWPFPFKSLQSISERMKKIFVTEMAFNQLEQDVILSVGSKNKIERFNKLGGAIFTEEEIADFVLKNIQG